MTNNKLIKLISEHVGAIIVVVIIILIIAPSLLTSSQINWLSDFAIFRNLDFRETGQIGDTIGGITAPFIGVLSIILLYITLYEQRKINKEQVEFNKRQIVFNDEQIKREQESRDFSILFNQLKMVDEAISVKINDVTYNCVEALTQFNKNHLLLKYLEQVQFIAKLAVPSQIVLSYSYIIKRSTFDKSTKDFFYISMYDRIYWLIVVFKDFIKNVENPNEDAWRKVKILIGQLEKAIKLYEWNELTEMPNA